MTDLQYMHKFSEYYANPEEKTRAVIVDSLKLVDILKVSAMKLSSAAGPWDNADNFDQCLIDCNDILELMTTINNMCDEIQETMSHYIKTSDAYFKIAEDLLKERDENLDTESTD